MNKTAFYADLNHDMRALLAGETLFLAAMGNFSALLYGRLQGANWAGFYLLSADGSQHLGAEAFSGQNRLRAHSSGQRRLRHSDGAG